MDSWNRTRIGAAVGGAIAVMAVGAWVAALVVPTEYPARAGYQVPGMAEPPVDLVSLQRSWPAGLSQPGAVRLIGYMRDIEKAAPAPIAPAPDAAPAPVVDLGTLLAQADVAKGKQKAQVCASCHSFEASGPDRIGPNLWAVVGRKIGGHAGFAYSAAVAKESGNWTYEKLDHWLASPARAVPGNKMAFAGIRQPQERANLLAYLGSLNSSPAPYPKPAGEASAAANP